MYQVTPKTEQCRDWIDENVYTEAWQWSDGALVVDHHFIKDLEMGMLDAGLTARDVIISHY